MTTLKSISPQQAATLLRKGATLIDIRGADEHARERIPGARHLPLDRIVAGAKVEPGDRVVIFHCRSGARTAANAERLAGAAPGCEAFMVEGGLEAWRKAGLTVALDRSQPIDIQRQVQIGAGSLVVLGVVLGVLVHPGFLALAGFVGAGLVFAGVTGFCGMAKLLAVMPWNRRVPAV